MNFSDRLRSACQIKGILGKDIATEMDVSPNTISGYMTGKNSPPLDFIERFCEIYPVRLAWLAAGVGTIDGSVEQDNDNQVVLIPRYKVDASAGNGALVFDEKPKDFMAYQRNWIEREKLDLDFLCVIGVIGDSMESKLFEGDSILIDRKIKDVSSGFAYVFRQENELLVKYLQRMPGNLLRVSSENPSYPPYDIDMNLYAESVQIIGRVVCSTHSWIS